MNAYRCFACDTTQAAEFSGWTCPSCGGNLDVVNDENTILEQVRKSPFETESIPLQIGNTPLYPAERLGQTIGLRNLYLKDDTVNPSASSKDRASAAVVLQAIDAGANIVSVASTGNAGSSLACIAAAAGLQAMVLVPENAPVAKLTQAMSFGATVLAVRGSYDDAFDLCLAASAEFGWFNRSTGVNPFTREGKKICAWEIWASLDGRVPDRVVVPTGDGNILSGMWKGWCELKAVGLIDRLPKIDCAQSTGSDAISRTVLGIRDGGDIDWASVQLATVNAHTVADSISVDRPRDGLAAVRAVIESGGEAIAVPDAKILAAIPEIAAATGVFPEPAAATPWAAVKQMVTDGRIAPDEVVVCLVSGNGLKDIASARKVAGLPQVIDPSLEALEAALISQ
ncbi:MAG: threonine synthase [Gammaproteobacteria bacterium]|nr:threonine synthase [Gammaproteobacteria bacterium]